MRWVGVRYEKHGESLIQKRVLAWAFLIQKKVLHLEKQFKSAVIFSPLGSLKWRWLKFVFCKGIAYMNAAQIFAKCVLIFFLGQWDTVLLGVCVCVYTHVLIEGTKQCSFWVNDTRNKSCLGFLIEFNQLSYNSKWRIGIQVRRGNS